MLNTEEQHRPAGDAACCQQVAVARRRLRLLRNKSHLWYKLFNKKQMCFPEDLIKDRKKVIKLKITA